MISKLKRKFDLFFEHLLKKRNLHEDIDITLDTMMLGLTCCIWLFETHRSGYCRLDQNLNEAVLSLWVVQLLLWISMVCFASKGLLNMRAVRDTATKYKQHSTKQPNQASDCIEFLYSDFSGQMRFFQQLGQESPLTSWCRKKIKTHTSLASLRLHRTGSFDKQHLKQTWRFKTSPSSRWTSQKKHKQKSLQAVFAEPWFRSWEI